MVSNEREKQWNILDPEIPLLAAEAAVEIDKFLNNKSKKFTSLSRLKERMKNISFVDLPTSSVIRRALAGGRYFDFEREGRSKDIQFLLNEILSTFEKVIENVEDVDRSELLKLEKFCISLSKILLALNQKFYNFNYREFIF